MGVLWAPWGRPRPASAERGRRGPISLAWIDRTLASQRKGVAAACPAPAQEDLGDALEVGPAPPLPPSS
eukprot:4842354-Alexandrium_andersonii.AAC.1